MTFSISEAPIDPAALKVALRNGSAGACVCFEGWTRDRNAGRDVTSLEYTAYRPLAEKEGNRILAEAVERFGVVSAACVHRVGSLSIGDLAVWVGVSSGHRGEAFEACRYIIDEVKRRVPIWKRESYAGGQTGWVEGNPPGT